MKKIKLYQADAFTETLFRGNPAGVVLEADDLTDGEMLQIANELGNSETAFFSASSLEDCDLRVRYFTPQKEVPLCGHATIAAHFVRAIKLGLEDTIVQTETNLGILPVEVVRKNNSYEIIMTQSKPETIRDLSKEEEEELIQALGLTGQDIDDYPIQISSTGHSKVMVPLKKRKILHALAPDYNHLAELSERIACNGYHCFTFDAASSEALVHSRMFAPAIGINEDPVTGMANGALGVYLVNNELVAHNGIQLQFSSIQGESIGRTGRVDVIVDIEDDRASRVRIKGKAVIVFEAELLL